jgi:hypothetical protein
MHRLPNGQRTAAHACVACRVTCNLRALSLFFLLAAFVLSLRGCSNLRGSWPVGRHSARSGAAAEGRQKGRGQRAEGGNWRAAVLEWEGIQRDAAVWPHSTSAHSCAQLDGRQAHVGGGELRWQ